MFATYLAAARKMNDMMVEAGVGVKIVLADDLTVSLDADGKIVNYVETRVLRVWKRKAPQVGADLRWTACASQPVMDARGSKASDALKAHGVDGKYLAALNATIAAHAPFAVR